MWVVFKMFPSCHRLIAVGLNLLSYKTIENHTNSNTSNTNTDTIPHRRRVEFNICHKASVTDSQDCRDEDFEKVKIAFGDFGDLEVAIQMVVEVVVEAKKLDKVVVAATLDKDK